MAAKWWCFASLFLFLPVAAASTSTDVPRDDCDTATFVSAATAAAENSDAVVDSARAVDEAKTADAFVGRTGDGDGLFGSVHGPLGGCVAGFGPFGGAVAGASPFGGFSGGGGDVP